MNGATKTFQDFVAGQSAQLSVPEFLLNLGLTAVLALVVGYVYVRFGSALSNRRQFARNFLPLALITTLVITIVKSSLALSLGLVGALSIVRFRAAIKEPEELIYLFLAIGIGLGMGASQREVTVVAMAVVLAVVVARGLLARSEDEKNLFLTVSSEGPGKVALPDLVQVLRDHCKSVDLKRFDENDQVLEASFLVELDGFGQLEASRLALQALGDSVNVSFVDNRGLG
jgi:lysylphosphatidylglycerol synthetase-like protein (DUF2156 family)